MRKDPRRNRRGPYECHSLLLVQTELLVEAAHTSARIHHLLLAGEKGVTLGANFHADVLLGRAGLDHITTGTLDGGLLVVGMDAFLHCCVHLFLVPDEAAQQTSTPYKR